MFGLEAADLLNKIHFLERLNPVPLHVLALVPDGPEKRGAAHDERKEVAIAGPKAELRNFLGRDPVKLSFVDPGVHASGLVGKDIGAEDEDQPVLPLMSLEVRKLK